jgi:hypothetical protein
VVAPTYLTRLVRSSHGRFFIVVLVKILHLVVLWSIARLCPKSHKSSRLQLDSKFRSVSPDGRVHNPARPAPAPGSGPAWLSSNDVKPPYPVASQFLKLIALVCCTSILFEGTADEKTIYLGPWEVVGNEHRRILWQCSYQLERLEHFLYVGRTTSSVVKLPFLSVLQTFSYTRRDFPPYPSRAPPPVFRPLPTRATRYLSRSTPNQIYQ